MMKMWFMKFLSRHVFNGVMLDVWSMTEIDEKVRKQYVGESRMLNNSDVLKNECAKIKNAAGRAIVRTTKVNEEVAYNRGILHAIDTLEKRIAMIAKLEEIKK